MATINRAMARVVRIDDIQPIDGADAIEVAKVGGWRVVAKKNEYTAGDLAVYCELDSWIPTQLAPFLSKGQEPKEYNGVKGERLRSAKLRGVISQGLLLPFNIIMSNVDGECSSTDWNLGDDVSKILGIQKYEPPIPAQLAGEIEGNFPTHLLPKTDQERIQNCFIEIKERIAKHEQSLLDDRDEELGSPLQSSFVVEEKLDGSSCTIILHDGKMRVCSRNLELRRNENNSFWKVAMRYEEALLAFHITTGRSFAFQGELIGEGIQGNPYKIKGQELYVFDMYDIDEQFYLVRPMREAFVHQFGMKNVPLVIQSALDQYENLDIDQCLTTADGNSILNPSVLREGVVYKCSTNGSITFKAISNRWLIKTGN